MRKLAGVTAFALAASVLSLAIVGTSGAIQQETVLTFTLEQTSQTQYDIEGEHELTPGDGWVSSSVLKKKGEVVGKMVESCQFATVRPDGLGGTLACAGTAKLDGGQVTLQLRLVLEEGKMPNMSAAVTGGTGDYANARGTASMNVDPDTQKVTVTFRLLP